MVGKPSPKASDRLVMHARNDAEKQLIKKFKEIIAEKGTFTIEILKPAIEAYVKEKWPPNPQLQIPQFNGQLPFSRETREKLNPKGDHHIEVDCSECSGSGENRWGGSCRGCNGIGKVGVEQNAKNY